MCKLEKLAIKLFPLSFFLTFTASLPPPLSLSFTRCILMNRIECKANMNKIFLNIQLYCELNVTQNGQKKKWKASLSNCDAIDHLLNLIMKGNETRMKWKLCKNGFTRKVWIHSLNSQNTHVTWHAKNFVIKLTAKLSLTTIQRIIITRRLLFRVTEKFLI